MSASPSFGGATFDAKRDSARLSRQLDLVRDFMLDGRWRTLEEIQYATHAPEASISARLRDLRKERNGGFIVEREYVERGLFRYRVLPPKKDERQMRLAI